MFLTVREWRKLREISQKSAADALGIHVNTYSNWEKKPETIPIKYCYQLANLFDVSVADICFDPTLQNVGNGVEA